MKNIDYSEIEKEMMHFDFKSLEIEVATAKASITSKRDLAGGLEKLCAVWHKIGKFVKLLEKVPVIGKYVEVLADLLDSICPA